VGERAERERERVRQGDEHFLTIRRIGRGIQKCIYASTVLNVSTAYVLQLP